MASPILVPLDGSALSEQALPPAAGIARRTRAPLHIVHVHVLSIPVGYPEAGVYFSAELEKHAREQEREYLDGVAARFPDLDVRTALLEGSIVNALEDYIAAERIGLVVMTTHGRSGLSRAWLGSIADALIRHVEIPILLQRPDPEGAEPARDSWSHVLIPLDGSEVAESILEHAVRIGSLTHARYTLVQVVPPADQLSAAEVAIAAVLPPQRLQQVEADALGYLESVADRLRAEGHDVRTAIVVHRQPALGIIEKAKELGADLIAIATHGRGGLRRVALGGVADKIIRSTHLPLLVYRPPKQVRARQRFVA